MYEYKYFDPRNLHHQSTTLPEHQICNPEQNPRTLRRTLRRITAEYTRATAQLTDLEMKLADRREEVAESLALGYIWDITPIDTYAAHIDRHIITIQQTILDLTTTDFNQGRTIQDLQTSIGLVTHEKLLHHPT